jgi:predicted unusual protein kinase regulating ubiquinone biosynthesis (AarF/ABC1/UbiB family)
VLLDFGLAKDLPPRFREGVLAFLVAMLRGDASAMAESLLALGFETRDGSAGSLREVAEVILAASSEVRARGALDPETLRRMREDLPARIRANPVIRMPHHLVLLGRVLGLLSGVSRSLDARVDLVRVLAPFAFGTAQSAPPHPEP